VVPEPLDLSRLSNGLPGVTPALGAMMAEAAAVCLENQSHAPGVPLSLTGEYARDYRMEWVPSSEQARRSYNDLPNATEHGAYGVSFLVMLDCTTFTVLEKSRKGTGVDWYLALEGQLFQHAARLEVSGILAGDRQKVEARTREKLRQVKREPSDIPTFVVIVEFGQPLTNLVRT
jgi:hypothetical protein